MASVGQVACKRSPRSSSGAVAPLLGRNSTRSAPKPRRRSPCWRRARRIRGCATPSTSCRKASCSSTPRAATSSGTSSTRDIYSRSADLFQPGVKLADTLRIGVERGDYPEAIGREEEWLEERLALLTNPGERHEQTLADGRVVLIEERETSDGGIIGLRVDITEMKKREASFRLLFDGNPVPMFVYALDDLRILDVNDAALEHYGYRREQLLRMTLRDIHTVRRRSSDVRGAVRRRVRRAGRPHLDGIARPTARRSTSRSSRASSPTTTGRRR